MLRLAALWAIFVAALILFIILREERLTEEGKIPVGRLRRLWPKQEKRIASRYRVNWLIRYQRAQGETRDLSQTGVGLVVRERLRIGSQIQLECTLPGQPFPMGVSGKVVWVREMNSDSERLFYVGVRFFKLDPKVETQLETVLKQQGETASA